MPDQKTILALLGPTASGKTALALDLAEALPGGGECISADSMQIYRGMDIGTASPTAEERARAPHHLLDVADPHASGFTVYEWLEHAEAAIEAIRDRGAHPIVVGGTNLYMRALLEGVTEGTPTDPDLRAELEAMDTVALRSELEAVDAAAATRIHPNDRRRTIRAIEVHRTSGRPLSEQQTQWSDGGIQPRADVRVICLEWPTESINRRINARVKAMMAEGFLDEVRTLLAKGPLGEQAAEAVGYRELADHLAGTCPCEEAVERIKIRSRRLAKQQRTWMRRFAAIPEAITVPCGDPNPDVPDARSLLVRMGLVD